MTCVWVQVHSLGLPVCMFEIMKLYITTLSQYVCTSVPVSAYTPSAGALGSRLTRKHKTDTSKDMQQRLTVVV